MFRSFLVPYWFPSQSSFLSTKIAQLLTSFNGSSKTMPIEFRSIWQLLPAVSSDFFILNLKSLPIANKAHFILGSFLINRLIPVQILTHPAKDPCYMSDLFDDSFQTLTQIFRSFICFNATNLYPMFQA